MNEIFFKCQFTKAVKLLGIFICINGIWGCKQLDVFEKNTSIPNQEWSANFSADGSFKISDTLASYQLFIVLRHTDAYKYNNIWLNVGLQSPGDSMKFQKLNLQLGTDAQGWYGTGMNDIYEVRRPLTNKGMRFIQAGTYQFKIFQIMRDEPLLHVLSAGMRLEKEEVDSGK